MSTEFTSPVDLPITRSKFLLGGLGTIALALLPFRKSVNTVAGTTSSSTLLVRKENLEIPDYSLDQAREKLDLWNIKHRESARSLKCEPPLSVILGLLLFKDRHDGIERDGWRNNPLNKQLREFFTQNRIRRILVAIASGEAGQPIHDILQRELHKTGGFGPIMSQMPLHLHYRAYIKSRVLDCYDPADLDSTTEGCRLKGLRRSLASCGEVNLDELLALPFQDAFRERMDDFV